MNILIPHSWLLEHLETSATPQQIQELLSLSGPSVERIYDKDGEFVYDIEVTTNRVDSMCVRGIAREAAVILSEAGIPSHLKPLTHTVTPIREPQLPLPQVIDTEGLCKRTLAVVLSHVSHAATPAWMAKRLTLIEQTIHDAMIDITNYVTHELGHPCHAFDYDKIMKLGGTIEVKTASAGQTFTTLDGASFTTVGGEIVFTNAAGEIIDFPAIKGTANTSVDESTENVLFWIESLPADKVRHGSMSHAIRTVAAQLNEKNVDPCMADDVLKKAVELYVSLCGAQQASNVFDVFVHKPQPQMISVPLSTCTRYLGIELAVTQIKDILIKLGCSVEVSTDTLIVTPPTFRPDITIPADVVEEIARIYGYHRLPSVLMATAIPTSYPHGVDFALESRTKRFLATVGLQEVFTYSLVSENIAQESGYSLAEHLALQNPLTEDRVYLRRTLIPSLREVCTANPQRPQLSVFEFAHTYQPVSGELPQQDLHLMFYMQLPYRTARGILEVYARQILFLPTVTIKSTPGTSKGAICVAENSEHILGTVEIDSHGATCIDLVWKEVLKQAHKHPEYHAQPKYPAITEDLTFTLNQTASVGSVIDTIRGIDPLIYAVDLLDMYKKNSTFRITYLDITRPLSSADVEPLRKKIVATIVEKQLGVLVGELT